MGFINLGEVKKTNKEIRHAACALVSLSDFSPPSVYKSHILNRTINKLYINKIIIKIKGGYLRYFRNSILDIHTLTIWT